jgi:hypothetical protein
MRESFHLSFALVACIFFQMDRLEYRILQTVVREYSMSVIGTPIIHYDDLIERSSLGKCRSQTCFEALIFVVGWDEEGYFHSENSIIKKDTSTPYTDTPV